ncbi:hypothetical protein SDC9_160798 [bioreactor metagenome]|uniref:Uncharacterized protein n=1 Tax=bioreactor metagenome TaxID=1076179 RepID=A0A645FGL6_9ZZZZ
MPLPCTSLFIEEPSGGEIGFPGDHARRLGGQPRGRGPQVDLFAVLEGDFRSLGRKGHFTFHGEDALAEGSLGGQGIGPLSVRLQGESGFFQQEPVECHEGGGSREYGCKGSPHGSGEGDFSGGRAAEAHVGEEGRRELSEVQFPR